MALHIKTWIFINETKKETQLDVEVTSPNYAPDRAMFTNRDVQRLLLMTVIESLQISGSSSIWQVAQSLTWIVYWHNFGPMHLDLDSVLGLGLGLEMLEMLGSDAVPFVYFQRIEFCKFCWWSALSMPTDHTYQINSIESTSPYQF